MTSSRKKHHPPAAGSPAAAPGPASSSAAHRVWVIRSLGVLGIAAGLSITLIGATPGIAAGWGALLMMVPGMVVATGSFVAVLETTPMARSRRRGT